LRGKSVNTGEKGICNGAASPRMLPYKEDSFFANDDLPEVLVVDDEPFNIAAIE